MKNFKKIGSVTLLFSAIFLGFTSCKKDEAKPAAPTIELVHLGTHEQPDSKIINLGDPGHFEYNITAPGLIKKIEIIIVQKSGYATYSNTKEYTGDYVGQKEVKAFHDHPVIPTGQAIGDYSFTIRVTDQQNQVSKLESAITVATNEGGEHEHEH